MVQSLRMRFRMRDSLATVLAALALAAEPVASQVRDETPRIKEYVDDTLQPLTAAEIQQATAVLQRDDRAHALLVSDQRVRTVFIERREDDKDVDTGQPRADRRRADVVLYNYDTDETISAVVTLGPGPRVEHLAVTPGQPAALGSQEVEEARQLALADPTVQAGLRAAGLLGRESEFIITGLRFQPAVLDEPCSTHRCVVLFFNTRDSVLGIEPIVDLTTREVQVR
jgi:Cu2+-containing amine oxidase